MQGTKNKRTRVKRPNGWVKNPITNAQISALKSKPFDFSSAQRTLRKYYKTSLFNKLLFVSCPLTLKDASIMVQSEQNYYKVVSNVHDVEFLFYATSLRQLLYKMRLQRLL